MASSPVKLLLLLLFVCIVGWIVFMFAARLVALLLSRIMGASVGFRISGWNCLRDVNVKFRKGAVESISVGEIKISLRRSLVKLGFGFISRDPKLQLLICDLEITIRQSEQKTVKMTKKSRSSSRGKWMILANIARFLSVSVTDLILKMPKTFIEVKNMGLDLFKTGGSNPTLSVKLHFVPLLLHFSETKVSFDQPAQPFLFNAEKNTVPFVCEDLYVECTFGHDREMGVGIRNVDVVSGDVSVNLSEELFLGRTSKASPATDLLRPATFEQTAVKKSKSAVSLKKNIHFFPEKVSLKLPRLNLRLMHQRLDFSVENNIMGIYLKSSKSQFSEDSGEATSHFDVQMDFSEIHLLSEGSKSLLEILKVAVVTSIDVPMQSANPVRAEIDVKLGGTQCNLMPGRLLPLLQLKQSKKKMVLQEGNFGQDKPLLSESKTIMWTCTVSAPEMNLVLHDVKGLPLYHGSSQSSHLFANNIASRGTQIHAELGELHLYMADEHQVCFKETLFDVEANSGSLVHIARVSLDLGHRELENLGNRGKEPHDDKNWPLVFSVDVTGMGVDLNFVQVESLVVNAMSFKTLLSKVSVGKKESKVVNSGKMAKKGVPVFKLNLEQCSIVFSGDVGLEDTVVADPKRVNFGSQGGENIISLSADGTSRQAQITSTVSNGSKYLKNSTCLDIFHLSLCVNKEKQHTRMELERARSVYKEYSEELGPTTNVTLFDVQNAKFVRRPGGLNENSVCSLFSATDITARWEPDVHVALYEVILRLRYLLHNLKLRSSTNETSEIITDDMDQGNESIVESLLHDKQQKKKDSVFAIDIEMLSVSAELADGVDALVQVQSIFSENARIGILLEGLILSFNEARVFKSSRMQISRLPIFASNNLLDAKALLAMRWDWVIQGLDVHICMPYRLQLRAIEDAVEDTLRGLKLICAAKRNILFPIKNSRAKKVKTGSSKFGSIRFNIRKLRAEIEEEPIQGWLDEHYQLMKNRLCELSSRLKFFDDLVSEGSKYSGTEPNDTSSTKIQHNGVDIDVSDVSSVKRLREEIQEKAFRSYYLACQELVHSGGSGACASGLQAGFKPSTARSSLLSLSATEVDITLNRIEEGDTGMIEFIKNLDPVSLDNDIPFSRLYGRNIVLHTGSLVAQLRNYTFPLFAGEVGKCEGCVVLAQQATCFQPQIVQDVYIGRWRKVCMLRSASGTTPPMKVYSRMPIYFKKGEVSFGVGYEPVFADISYAFTVALRRANLSIRGTKLNMQNMVSSDSSGSGSTKPLANQMAKKERSLPWWDDIRYYIHGNFGLIFQETRWSILGTTNPYENLNKLQIVSGYMEIQHIDGHVTISAKEFKIFVSSLESLMNSCGLKPPPCASRPFLYSSSFSLEVIMEWECESGNPLNHYLHALPNEGLPRSKVYDPFRSTSLSLRWNFSLRPTFSASANRDVFTSVIDGGLLDKLTFVSSEKAESILSDIPTVNMGAHDLMWLFKWWSLLYNPPHKLRSFSRWPRFGIPRVTRSGNLSLDKVMTEFFLRLDATPACIKHVTLGDDDPAGGLTFKMTKLKYELCYSRGLQHYTFNCKREPLDLVYRGLDLHLLKVYINRDTSFVSQDAPKTWKCSQHVSNEGVNNGKNNTNGSCDDKHQDDGFLLSSDYFTIRRQAPMADHARLLAWQDAGRKNLEMTYVRSEFESDQSDEDGYNVVVADNCQRVFVYGLKLLWTIQNRDAVWSWVGAISKAFEPPKPSPSRQYTQRKLIEGREKPDVSEVSKDDSSKSSLAPSQGPNSPIVQPTELVCSNTSTKTESTPSGLSVKNGAFDDEEEGTRHFMVNVIQPQFNLHSEEANGRFLLAAASGHVLARSFHSVLHVGYEEIEKALGADGIKVPEAEPEMTWKRAEFSVMLKHVQAHVAPTDVDPGAGLQWLPKILRNSPEVKRTGALLERVFMPCQMYFRYTRHKGGLADLKVKPLKDLSFNSPNIAATMTSRQFQVMLDVLSNLLFARLPKPRKSSLSYPTEDEDIEEEIDEVVPDGVEEVELARINLEQKERERKLLLDDIRSISSSCDSPRDLSLATQTDSALWMIAGSKSSLVQGLKVELGNIQKSRKTASVNLRMALQKAAQIRLMEKEKNKSPSCAMRISMKINKVVWSMLADGKSFAEAEINDMIYDFDRDYKDIGIAQFTIRSFEVRNCLLNAKSTVLLSSWNPPIEWGRNMMLRVDAKQGAPKDGASLLELFQVEIYPLKIYLTETMYRMMWDYFFPEEEQDSQRRQEVWKVSTTAGTRRGRKSASVAEAASNSYSLKDSEAPTRVSASTTRVSASTTTTIVPSSSQSSSHTDASQVTRLQNLKANNMCGSSPELRRTSSFDKISEENMAGSVSNEIVLHVHSSVTSSSKSGPLSSAVQPSHAVNEDTSKAKSKDSKSAKSGRLSHEEKKVSKSQDEKKSRARKMMDFHNIKISQVELLVTYEGSRFAVSELRLLMDTFHRVEFTGTWRRLFSRVKKHIIWGVLKSVTGMQGKKFKDKAQSHKEINGADVLDIDLSDSDGCQPGKSDQLPMWLKRPNDGAGDGFVTSIKGLFNSQRRKAKAFVKRTMRGEPDSDAHADCSGSDVEVSPFARQLTITTKKLIRRGTKKFRPKGQKNSGASAQPRGSTPSSPTELTPNQSDSSSASPTYKDIPD